MIVHVSEVTGPGLLHRAGAEGGADDLMFCMEGAKEAQRFLGSMFSKSLSLKAVS